VDLPSYPDQPPRKWVAQGFNTVRIEFSLSGLRAITLEGFGAEATANIVLARDNGISIEVASPEIRIRAVADTAYISKLTAYTNE